MPLSPTVATPDDAQALTALLRRAKGHWGYPEAWMRAWRLDLTLTADYIRHHRVVVLKEETHAAGFYGLEFRPEVAYLAHLWVEPDCMGRGVGRALLRMACAEAIDRGYEALELVADPNAESFYVRHGATRVGEVRGTILGTPRVLPQMRLSLSAVPSPA